MPTTTTENLRCMMCGHEYTEQVEKGEDKERSCPKCRSNSIRHMKKKAVSSQLSAFSKSGATED